MVHHWRELTVAIFSKYEWFRTKRFMCILIIMFRSYIVHIISKWRLYALEALLPQLMPSCSLSALRAFEGIHFCWVPSYYTWVKRDNCGQNALSKGVCTEWDSNPRSSDCQSRARTTTPQCSH